jgi:FAD/FMN-containing dehydrogenase
MFSIFKRPPTKPLPAPQPPMGTFPRTMPRPPAGAAYAPPPPIAPAPATGGIAYDPHLVEKLKDDHQHMIAIYSRLLADAQAAKLDSIRDDLVLFRRVFQGHILMESVRFYVYLDRLLAEHDSVRDEARAVRKDMNGIAKAVAEFIHQWMTIPITLQTLPTFIEQLQGIGAALVARVELEESSLYTLYTEKL